MFSTVFKIFFVFYFSLLLPSLLNNGKLHPVAKTYSALLDAGNAARSCCRLIERFWDRKKGARR